MSIKRIVDTKFWDDEKVIDTYSIEDKYFLLYLLTNPRTSQLGIYKIPKKIISFETGYTKEIIEVLLQRFETKYKNIVYDNSTQEVTVLNSLKYSIVKGGKPVSDLLTKELRQIESENLIQQTYEHMITWWEKSSRGFDKTVKELFETELYERKVPKETNDNGNDNENENDDSYHDSYHDSLHPTHTNGKSSPKFSPRHFEISARLKENLQGDFPKEMKKVDLNKWADVVRLMEERDHLTMEQIEYVVDWLPTNDFWFGNIRSTKKLREQFDKLVYEIKKEKKASQRPTYQRQPIRKEVLPDWANEPQQDSEDPEKQAEIEARMQKYLANQ